MILKVVHYLFKQLNINQLFGKIQMILMMKTNILNNRILRLNKRKRNFHYVAMLMMTLQILKSVNFTKTQKSRYLENETLFFLQKKNSLIIHQGLHYCKN